MSRIKYFNPKSGKWEYADSLYKTGGNVDLTGYATEQFVMDKLAEIDGSFELIESITVTEDGLTAIARTAEPDGKPYDLSAVTVTLKVYGTDVMLGTQVDYYSGNEKIGSLLENIAVTYYTASNKFSSCVYHVRPKAGIYEFVSAYGAHAAMMDVHYPSNADYQTVDASKKITKIEFKLWTATNIPVGTQIEIYGVRA